MMFIVCKKLAHEFFFTCFSFPFRFASALCVVPRRIATFAYRLWKSLMEIQPEVIMILGIEEDLSPND